MPAGSQSPKRTRISARKGRAGAEGGFDLVTDVSVMRRFAFLELGDDPARDDQLLYFGGAFINAQGTDFAVQALYCFLALDAQTSENLHGCVNYLLRGFGGGHLGHGGFDGDAATLIAQPCSAVGEERGGIDARGHRG